MGRFEKGNKWQFSEENQPSRIFTEKQMLAALDKMLSMNSEEISGVASDESAPLFLRRVANKLQEGEVLYVVDIRAKYKTSLSKKKEI